MTHAQTRPPARADRFEALDALRGLCALLVVFFHIPVRHALKDAPAFANLQVCVDVFFVLSGFVLTHAYGGRLATAADGLRFAGRRVLRLWPLHAVVLVLLVGLELAKLVHGRADAAFVVDAQPFSQGRSPFELATNLVFLQAFGLHPGLSWNGPAWSAAVEFWISLLFAALLILFPRRRLAAFLTLAAGAGLVLVAVSPETLYVSTDWGGLRAGLGFFTGTLVHALHARLVGTGAVPRGVALATGLELGCLAGLLAAGLTIPPGPAQFLFLAPVAATILVFSFQSGLVSRAFRWRPLQALGLWSYSIYMVHALVFQVLKTGATFLGRRLGHDLVVWHGSEKLVVLGPPETASPTALLLSVVLVVPLAALTYRLVERPAMRPASWRWVFRRGRRDRAPVPGRLLGA